MSNHFIDWLVTNPEGTLAVAHLLDEIVMAFIHSKAWGNYPTKDVSKTLHDLLTRLHLEYAIQAICLYPKRHIYDLKKIPGTAPRLVKYLRGLTYEDQLEVLNPQDLRS